MPEPVLRPAKPDRGDANGNMTSGDGRTLTWTPFNMPLAITQGASTLTFTYDTEHGRIKQVAPDGTTLYINDTSAGLKSEKFIGASSTRWVNYVYAGGGIAAVVNVDSVAGTTTRYFHKDHLGSTAVITDESGNLVERLAYDSWGKRRNTNGADDPTNSLTSLTTRGFTGHEHLQAVALVHMNGRVYDPLLGRFLSADPHIQDAGNTQSLNRYSYVLNNPLCYTDPNGFFLKGLFKALTRPFGILGFIFRGAVDKFFANSQFAQVLLMASSVFCGPAAAICAAGNAAYLAGVNGGSLGDMLKAAIIAGASSYAGSSIANSGMSIAAQVGTSAVVGGIASAASGGDFGKGFLSAGFTAFAGAVVPNAGLIGKVIIGGTASVIGGGKFANGAITAAFVYTVGQINNAASIAAGGPEPEVVEDGVDSTPDGRNWVNPTGGEVRGCDRYGCGAFGATRTGPGGRTYPHQGADYVANSNQNVLAVTDGTVTGIGIVYTNSTNYRYVQITTSDGYIVREMYVRPLDTIRIGSGVTAGQVIGSAQSLQSRYPGITDHIHVEIRQNRQLINPQSVIP